HAPPGGAAPFRASSRRVAGRGIRSPLRGLPPPLLRDLRRRSGGGPHAPRDGSRRRAARLTAARGPMSEARGAPYCLEWRDGLAVIHLTAGKANALNPRSLAAIEQALDDASGGGARGVVLTGYDRFFSAGLDLVALYGLERDDMDRFMTWFDAVMLRVF